NHDPFAERHAKSSRDRFLCMLGPKPAGVKPCAEPQDDVPGRSKRGKMHAPFAPGACYVLPSVAATPGHTKKEPSDGRDPTGPGRSRARGDASRVGACPGDGGGGARTTRAPAQRIDRAHGAASARR